MNASAWLAGCLRCRCKYDTTQLQVYVYTMSYTINKQQWLYSSQQCGGRAGFVQEPIPAAHHKQLMIHLSVITEQNRTEV